MPKIGPAERERFEEGDLKSLLAEPLEPERPKGPVPYSPEGLPGGTVYRVLGRWVAVALSISDAGRYTLRVFERAQDCNIRNGGISQDKATYWRPWFRTHAQTSAEATQRAHRGVRKRLLEGDRPEAIAADAELAKLHVYWRDHGQHFYASDM